jgi:hypothetical protein
MTTNSSQRDEINLNSKLIYNKFNRTVTKSYNDKSTGQIRFKREKDFYIHCNKIGYKNVPLLFEINEDLNNLIIEYIEKDSYYEFNSLTLIDQYIGFITSINIGVINSNFLNAQECVIEKNDLINNIEDRLNKNADKIYLDVKFLNIYKELKSKYFKMDCTTGNLILNPSDFGNHNIIIRNKKPIFIDFEYAGIDSLQKAIFDFLLHPQNKLLPEIDYHYKVIDSKFKYSLNYNFEEFATIKKIYICWWIIRLKESINKLKNNSGNFLLLQSRMDNIKIFEKELNHEY